jgi:Mrp family chromosome partitioning ATPase
MEPIEFWRALRRSWRLLVLLALVGAFVAVMIPVSHAKTGKAVFPYAATTVVGGTPINFGSPLHGGVTAGQIAFYATQSSTKVAAVRAAGIAVPDTSAPAYLLVAVAPAEGVLPANAGAKVRQGTPLNVLLTGYGSTPEQAVAVSSAYADQVQGLIADQISTNGKNGRESGLAVINPAVATSTQLGVGAGMGASRKVRALGGLAVGAALGAGIVLLIEMLDQRLRSVSRVEASFRFPVIVEIPVAPLPSAGAEPELVPVVDVLREPASPGAEAYRMLRMSVMFENLASLSGPIDPFGIGFGANDLGQPLEEPLAVPAPPVKSGPRKVVMVASAGTEPTRPHVAANLAAVYAEGGQRVVVISTGDLEAGRSSPAPLDPSADIRIEDVEARLEPSRLELVFRLSLSPFVANSSSLVNRAPAVLEAARSLFDVVIVEVPPILALHHTEALARLVDAVVVVAEYKCTTSADARQAADLLRRIGAPVLGVVFTNVHIDAGDIRLSALSSTVGDEDRGEPVLVGGAVGSGSESTSPPPG